MRKALWFLLLPLCSVMAAHAQSYRYATSLLRQLAIRVNFSPDTARFVDGACAAQPYRGCPVVVECGSDHVISHIGFSLFDREMKKAVKPNEAAIMRFIERYALEMMSQHEARLVDKMADDKVYFRKGSLDILARQAHRLVFSLTKHPNYYEAVWSSPAGRQTSATPSPTPTICLVFPPKIELIAGSTLPELQNALKDLIQRAGTRPLTENTWEEEELTRQEGGLWLSPASHYVMPQLNNALTLEKSRGKFRPVFDADHKEASAINLALGAISSRDYKLVIQQSLYGFKQVQYTVTLNQWLNYCAQSGLRLYASLEEEREDGLKLFVLAESPDLGYNHVMSLVIPSQFCTAASSVLKATLTSYIPTDNVKNLYQNYKAKQKKNIRYE